MEGKNCNKCGEWKVLELFPYEKNKGKMVYRGQCKKCRAAYKLELSKKNPAYAERTKEATKKWLKSPEGKEWQRLRGIENRKKPIWKEYQKKGREKYRSSEENRAKEKAYRQAYVKTDTYRQKNRAALMKYRKTELYKKWLHSERGKEIRYKARLKRRSLDHDTKFSPIIRKELLDRDKWKCQACGVKVHDRSSGNWNTPDKAHIDHILPLSKGGNSEPSNLQTLCRTCNLTKSDKVEYQLPLF